MLLIRTRFSFSINSVNFKGFLNIFTISEAVREVQNALTKDAVENKIKNWLRHCPRY